MSSASHNVASSLTKQVSRTAHSSADWEGGQGLAQVSLDFLAATEEEPVDLARLNEMVDDDPTGRRELVNLYLVESAELMASLCAAVQSGLAAQVEWAAHKLGGSSATCGMIGIVAPLRELERSGRAGLSARDGLWLHEARRQHGRICAFLSAHVLQN